MARAKRKDHESFIPFDTLSYAKKLKSAGFTEEQAEIQAETFLAIVQEQLVSKRDLKELENELKKDIKALEVKTETGFELLRRDLKIWMGGMLVVSVSVLGALITFLAHVPHGG
jgi:hypothetical protein